MASTPMLRVPDVAAAIAWYEHLGYRLVDTDAAFSEDGRVGWCLLCLNGSAPIMLRDGATDGYEAHGDVTISVDVADVQALFERVAPLTTVVYAPRLQPYGRVDFEIRDLNGFRLLFGQD